MHLLWPFFVVSVIEPFGIPLPSGILFNIMGALFYAHQLDPGWFFISLVIIWMVDMVSFTSYRHFELSVHHFFISKAPLLEKGLLQTQQFLQTHQSYPILLGKLQSITRSFVPISAAGSAITPTRFLLEDGLAVLIWGLESFAIGYLLAAGWDYANNLQQVLQIVIGGTLITGFATYLLKRYHWIGLILRKVRTKVIW